MVQKAKYVDEVVISRGDTDLPGAAHVCDGNCHPVTPSDNKNVIIAVGAAVVLFIVGLVLGYLLGRTTGAYAHDGLMNSGNNRSFERGTMPMLRANATSTTTSSTQGQ